MSLIALPTTSTNRKRTTWLVAPVVVVLVLAGAWALTLRRGAAAGPTTGTFYTVGLADLDVRINKDGELQAIHAIEIQSAVEGQTTIQTLVKEGSSVNRGDVLITLDSAQIRQKIEDTYLDLQKAEADLTNSRELREIQISKNNADLEAAEVALTLSQLALKQYQEGTYPQQLNNAETELKMAGINLANVEEKLAQTKALASKGFVTMTQVKDDELALTNAQNNLRKAETAFRVLTEYTHQMELAERENAVSQAEQRLARVKRENAASLSQRDADVRAKEQALSVLRRRMERLEEQLAACTIRAPADGMVVYATSNDRNAQNALQEGMQVRERQNLLRLPDTRSMKAVVRIPETQVARLREGMRASITLPNQKDPVGATITKISVLADNSQRWWNPDLKEYPVDLSLDQTPPALKPGMGVTASIYVQRLKDVLAVPLTTIYSAGQQSWVFTRSGSELKPVEVKIGATNDTHAQITEGLRAGQVVKILEIGEGQLLLERAGIRVAPRVTQEAEELGDGPPMPGPDAPGGPSRGRPGGAIAPGDGEGGGSLVPDGQRPRGGNPGMNGGERPRTGERRRPARPDGEAAPAPANADAPQPE